MQLPILREEIICQPNNNYQPKYVCSEWTSVGTDRMISEYLAFVRYRLRTNTVEAHIIGRSVQKY